jgi:hypothetical protein
MLGLWLGNSEAQIEQTEEGIEMQRRELGLTGELLAEAAIGGGIGAVISIVCLFAIPPEKLVSVGVQRTIPTLVVGCAIAGIATGRFSRINGYNEAVRENNERIGYGQATQQATAAPVVAAQAQAPMAHLVQPSLVQTPVYAPMAGQGNGAVAGAWDGAYSNGHPGSEGLLD